MSETTRVPERSITVTNYEAKWVRDALRFAAEHGAFADELEDGTSLLAKMDAAFSAPRQDI